MKRVLFLCPDNASRSPMAEALLRASCGGRFESASAGLKPRALHPLAQRVMEEIGLDLSDHRPQAIRPLLGRVPVAWAIIVCDPSEANCPKLYPDALETLRWALPDPSAITGSEEVRLAAFREVRDQLDARIREWLEQNAEP